MRKSRLNCNLKTMVTDWSTWHKMMGFIRPFFPTLDKLRDFFRFKSLPTTTTNKRCYQNLLNQSKLVSFTKLIWLNLKKEKHHDKNSSKCCGIFFGSSPVPFCASVRSLTWLEWPGKPLLTVLLSMCFNYLPWSFHKSPLKTVISSFTLNLKLLTS